ncbi:MAG: hypothetical protein CFE21_16345 [Bacteroidetes bacterium B1(2017)]|nr:MAG: hypothetical protein CFE21_16345 [Bacteroidetes bacterium B1(2017)]
MKKFFILLILLTNFCALGQSSTLIEPNSNNGILSKNATLVAADPGSITLPVSGAGTRLMWIPAKSAFRIGTINGTQWDALNIGTWSFAAGSNTKANGNASTSFGNSTTASGAVSTSLGFGSTASGNFSTSMTYNTIASGDYSTSMGYQTTASGEHSASMGFHTFANGFSSTSMGHDTKANGDYSMSMGYYTTAQAQKSVVMGAYNVVSGSSNTDVATDPLFVVGNGTSFTPSNALSLLKNANLGINIASPLEKLHVVGGMLAVNTSTVSSDPGVVSLPISGAGTRLMWIASKGAFRVGTVLGTEWDASNIGTFSFATGYNNVASGRYSTSMGAGTQASGLYAISTGLNTIASGDLSTSMGNNTTASRFGSTSMGWHTTASGDFSTSMGDNTTAQSYASTVLGRYNAIAGSSGTWIDTDPLFVVGNGIFATPNNALTVLKNANLGINVSNPHAPLQFSNAAANRKIVLYETADNDHQFYGLGINGFTLRYQVDATSANHIFYAATSSSASTELMRITGLGKVGIGVTSPEQILDINGRARVRHNGSTAGIWMSNALNGLAGTDGAFFGLETATAGTEKAGIWVGGAWRFTVDRSGNGNFVGCLTASNLSCPSDLRYKKNITSLNNSLENVLKINGVRYDFKKEEFPERNFSDKNQIGFIAQELEEIFPEMVFTDEKGYKSVDYAKLTPVLVEAMKEQQKMIDDLRKANGDLKNINDKLESRLDKIESILNK